MVLYDIIWLSYVWYVCKMCLLVYIYIYQLMPRVYLSSQFAVGDTTVFYCGGYWPTSPRNSGGDRPVTFFTHGDSQAVPISGLRVRVPAAALLGDFSLWEGQSLQRSQGAHQLTTLAGLLSLYRSVATTPRHFFLETFPFKKKWSYLPAFRSSNKGNWQSSRHGVFNWTSSITGGFSSHVWWPEA